MERVFNKKRLSNRDNLILTCFSIYSLMGLLFLSVITENSYIQQFAKLIQLLVLGIIGICLVYDLIKRRLKINLLMVGLGLLSLLSLVFSRQTHILVFVVMLYALRNIDLKDIVSVGARVMMLALFVIATSACLGLIPNTLAFRESAERYSLGFAHPTFPQYLLMMVAIANGYLFGSNISYSTLGFEAIAAFYLYKLTNSRAGFLLVLLIVAITIICKLLKKYRFVIDKIMSVKVVKVIAISVPILVFLFSLGCVFLYSKNVEIVWKFDRLLSTRISLAYNAFKNHELTLFGQEIVWSLNGRYFGLDNAYFYLLFNRGIVVLGLFIALYMYIIAVAIKNKDWWLLLFIMIVLVDSIIDPILDDYKYNFFIFMASGLLTKKKSSAIYCD